MALFPPRREPSINYDWIDIASATGYIVFDGLNAKDSTGSNYVLIDSSHAAKLVAVGDVLLDVLQTAGGATSDNDFDLSIFQLPRTIEGDVFVRISVAANTSPTDNQIITAKLRKWNAAATSETEIVSVASDTFNLAGNEGTSRTLKLVVPKTHFKKGDQLRLTIQLAVSTTYARLAHNPRDTAIDRFLAGSARLTIAVPFKLDFM